MEKFSPLKNRIAIIGGGISGLASAKYALECGFLPTLFEKRGEIGGIWSPTGYTWNSLKTNASRYMDRFSDHNFPKDTPNFPSNKEILAYMKSYIAKFGLSDYIHLNSEVTYIGFEKTEEIWKVEFTDLNTKEAKKQEFGNLIVATGFYNIPNLDYFMRFMKDESNNKIEFMHSVSYKENSMFRGKDVVVVGCSFSSQQIASEIANVSKSLVNVFRRPSWVIKRMVFNTFYQKELPMDFTFFTLKSSASEKGNLALAKSEKNSKVNNLLSKICNQNDIEELFIDENSQETPVISIADDYVESIEKGLIKPIKSGIKDIQNNTVTLYNGTILRPDIVFICTGYKSLIPNLDKTVLDELNFEKDDEICPLNLYNTTFNPKYKTLAFVGVYKGLFLGSAEIQAKYALNYLSGKNKVSNEEIEQGLKEQMLFRKAGFKPQYANGGYVAFLNKMAQEMDMMPDLAQIMKEDMNYYNFLMNTVVSPVLYFINNEDPKKKREALFLLEEVKERFELP